MYTRSKQRTYETRNSNGLLAGVVPAPACTGDPGDPHTPAPPPTLAPPSPTIPSPPAPTSPSTAALGGGTLAPRPRDPREEEAPAAPPRDEPPTGPREEEPPPGGAPGALTARRTNTPPRPNASSCAATPPGVSAPPSAAPALAIGGRGAIAELLELSEGKPWGGSELGLPWGGSEVPPRWRTRPCPEVALRGGGSVAVRRGGCAPPSEEARLPFYGRACRWAMLN